jgi:hypothetical protein
MVCGWSDSRPCGAVDTITVKRKRKQNARLRVSPQQLAQFGLELVTRDPLVVRCATCGAEWRPTRLPQAGTQNTEWHCRSGAHQPLQAHEVGDT